MTDAQTGLEAYQATGYRALFARFSDTSAALGDYLTTEQGEALLDAQTMVTRGQAVSIAERRWPRSPAIWNCFRRKTQASSLLNSTRCSM